MRHGIAALAIALLPATGGMGDTGPTVVVGAKAFTENAILAELMAQTIAARTDATVERRLNLAGTQVCFEALRNGEIDVYAEYTGTGLRNILGDNSQDIAPATAYASVAREFASRFGTIWLSPFGFDNTYVLLMRPQQATALGIEKISDLARHPLRFGVSHEFLDRPDGMPGLRREYRLRESDTRGLSHELAYQGLLEGSIDVTDGYSTDAKIVRHGLFALADDRAFFPPYEAVPLIRGDLEKRVPGAVAALRLLAGRIDDAAMRRMNFQVEDRRRSAADVASAFLNDLGLAEQVIEVTEPRHRSFPSLLYQRRWETLTLALHHLGLTAGAVVLACLVGVPLGIAASRNPAIAKTVLGAAGIMQTIPSIAMLAFMLPVFGIGVTPALMALFLYALLPILRNTVTGIKGIEERLIEIGRGLGMTDGQILRQIELPLALPLIMAGIRTATVICVGTATLAAFIGAGGLGDPIVTGLSTTDYALVMCGALPAAALAMILDYLLGIVERRTAPQM